MTERTLVRRRPPAVRLRQATTTDVWEIVGLLTEASVWAEAWTRLPMWPIPYPADRVRAAVDRGEVIVAVAGDRLVGTMTLSEEDKPIWGPQPPEAGYVHRLAVRREFAGRGLGARLLREAETRIRRRGRSKIRLDTLASNARLVRYYRELGFRRVGRVRAGPFGEERDLVLLERRLGPPRRGRPGRNRPSAERLGRRGPAAGAAGTAGRRARTCRSG